MGQFRFITNRTLANKAGRETGKIKAAVRNGSDRLEGEYTCPECQHSGKVGQKFKRPLAVRCGKCSFSIKLSRLKGKAK